MDSFDEKLRSLFAIQAALAGLESDPGPIEGISKSDSVLYSVAGLLSLVYANEIPTVVKLWANAYCRSFEKRVREAQEGVRSGH